MVSMGATPDINMRDPLRTFDWRLAIDGEMQSIELCIATAFLPQFSSEEIELPYRNSRTWVAGKENWEPGSIICRDFTNPSVAQEIFDWMKKVFDPETGNIGYTAEYKKSGAIYVLDTKGIARRTWDLEGIWPVSVNYGTLDYAASDVIQIELTLRYDRAIPKFSSNSMSFGGQTATVALNT